MKTPPQIPASEVLKHKPKNLLEILMAVSRHGDVVQVPHIKNMFLINHPDGVQHILQTNQSNYTKNNTYSYDGLAAFMGRGLLTNSGDAWQTRRFEVQPAFFYKHLVPYADLIIEQTQRMLERWERYAKNRLAFDVTQETSLLVTHISIKALLGIDPPPGLDKLIHEVDVVNEVIALGLLSTPIFYPLKFCHALICKRSVDKYIKKLISRAKETHEHPHKHPLLFGLLHPDAEHPINDQVLLQEVKNFLVAGFETTAISLAWTLWLLAKNPHYQQRLQEELRHALKGKAPHLSDLDALVFNQAVLDETLRLRPPIWSMERRSLKDDEICGYAISADSGVIMSQFILHHDPRFWESPELFYPERFLPEERHKIHKYAYFPFGTGPRVCIGRQLAMMINHLALSYIFDRYSVELFSPLTNDPDLLPYVTLRPHKGIWLRLTAV